MLQTELRFHFTKWYQVPEWVREEVWLFSSSLEGFFLLSWDGHLTTLNGMRMFQIRSDQISCSVLSDSLRPHESRHARPPCPLPTPEFTQTHVHQVSDAIQPSHPLSSPSPPAPNPSQHQSLCLNIYTSCAMWIQNVSYFFHSVLNRKNSHLYEFLDFMSRMIYWEMAHGHQHGTFIKDLKDDEMYWDFHLAFWLSDLNTWFWAGLRFSCDSSESPPCDLPSFQHSLSRTWWII